MLSEKERKRAFNVIFITQSLGVLPLILFQNGFYLNYFSKLGMSSAAIAVLFALPPLLSVFMLMPFAFYSDRFGKKRLALGGQLMVVVSLLVMMSASWDDWRAGMFPIVLALVLFSVGGSLQAAGWFALLSPIVPKEMRGRFFGRLRVIFQLIGILFTLAITHTLKLSHSMAVFQIWLGIVFFATVVRFFTYTLIPELENMRGEAGHRQGLGDALKAVLKIPGYAWFNGYVLLIAFFTASAPIVFGLMQKDVFGFTPSQITLMGTLFLAGSVIGCWLGGRLVDRKSTRHVLLVSHVAYAVVLSTLLARHWMPWTLPVHVGGCVLLYSVFMGMAGVAVTTESLALIPSANKSLSTSFTMTLINGGAALSSMMVARIIDWGFLRSEWRMWGHTYTDYDALILFFTGMILLMLLAIAFIVRSNKEP